MSDYAKKIPASYFFTVRTSPLKRHRIDNAAGQYESVSTSVLCTNICSGNRQLILWELSHFMPLSKIIELALEIFRHALCQVFAPVTFFMQN